MNILAFIVSFGLFLLGIWLFAFAFQTPGYESVTFIGGIVACTIGVVIPIHVLKRID